MVLHYLVGRLTTHIHIEPNDLLVVGSEHEIVTLRMNRDRRDPLGTGLVLVYDSLFLQIVLENCHMCRCEEVRFGRVECKRLDYALGGAERFLGSCL